MLQVIADDLLSEAKAWRAENPEAFGAIVRWAYEDAARPDGTCSMQRYVEALRNPQFARLLFTHHTSRPYLFDHRIRSAVTRLVMAEHPALPFRVRKSSVDRERGTFATPRLGA